MVNQRMVRFAIVQRHRRTCFHTQGEMNRMAKNLPPKWFVIHASATYPDMDIDIEWIRNIHVNQNGWCFSLDTEVLTDKGWKNYENIQETDRVFTYQDGFISDWDKLFWENNDCVSLKTQNYDAIFTMNHKIITKSATNKSDVYKPRMISEVLKVSTVQSVLTSLDHNGHNDTELEGIDFRLLSCIVADGFFCYYRSKVTGEDSVKSFEFHFKKDRKIKYVKSVRWIVTGKLYNSKV